MVRRTDLYLKNSFAINNEFELCNSGLSTPLNSADAPRHRWYLIKEAFAPELFLKAYTRAGCKGGGLVVDPFCGCGTLPVASAQSGHTSLGIEVNPFLAFVSRTKLLNCGIAAFRAHRLKLESSVKSGHESPLEKYSTFSERSTLDKWLFNVAILRSFEGGWNFTNHLKDPIRSLYRLALVGAAMDTCNAVPDGKCLRYRRDWKNKVFGSQDFMEQLGQRLNMMSYDLKEDKVASPDSKILHGDARQALRSLPSNSLSLCVTSPPYLNSFDYSDVYRPELFLSKCVRSNDQLTSIRRATIRSHVQTMWGLPTRKAFGSVYEGIMKDIERAKRHLWDRRLPTMIQAYCQDIEQVLFFLRRAARSGAEVWLNVSTSAYAGIEIPVDLIIAQISEKVGWRVREVGLLRHLRSSGQHTKRVFEARRRGHVPRLRESVVILEAKR